MKRPTAKWIAISVGGPAQHRRRNTVPASANYIETVLNLLAYLPVDTSQTHNSGSCCRVARFSCERDVCAWRPRALHPIGSLVRADGKNTSRASASPTATTSVHVKLPRSRRSFLSSGGDFRIRQRMSRDTRSLNDVLTQREKLADDRKSSGAQWRTYSVVAVSCAGNFRVNQPGVSSFLSLIVLRFYRRGNWEGYTQKITLSVWAFRPETRTVSPEKRF